MTKITDGEAIEVLWASSGPGKAALRAAFREADRLGLPGVCGRPGPSGTDEILGSLISSLVWAAFRAAGHDPVPPARWSWDEFTAWLNASGVNTGAILYGSRGIDPVRLKAAIEELRRSS